MKGLLERLNDDEALICDGAMGTILIDRGMPAGACPESWAIKNRRLVGSIYKGYISSGADMITANTFGANSIKLKKYNLSKSVGDINKRAVDIAREAAGDGTYVLGDIGPTGEYIKPAGSVEYDEMFSVFSLQVKALAAAGVDAIILETMSDMEELKAAVMAVKEAARIPLIASMTFQRTKNGGFRTTSGISIPQFVDYGLLAGCDIIGTNCTLGASEMIGLISEMRALCSSFLIAQPNAGMPRLIGDKAVYEESADEFAAHIPDMASSGANIIGGCCGTTPEHILKAKEALAAGR